MRNKLLSALVLMLGLVFSGNLCLAQFTPPDGTITNVVKALNDQADILSFSVENQTGPTVIDNVEATVTIEVALGTNVNSLNPTFTLSPGATAYVNDVLQESSVSWVNFTDPVTYVVKAENEVDERNWTVTVKLEQAYVVTFATLSDNGFISAYIDDYNNLWSGQQVPAGKDIYFEAYPKWGYMVKEWNVNGDPIEDYFATQFVYENIQSNLHVTVDFQLYTQPEIMPEYLLFGLANPEDVVFDIVWGSESEITEIKTGYYDEDLDEYIDIELVADTDYSVVEDKLTIYSDFILSLNPEPINYYGFSAKFGLGGHAWFGVVVVETTKPYLLPDELEYDLYNPGDLLTNIVFARAKEVVSIHEGENELVQGTDYSIEGAFLFIHNSYLAELLTEVDDKIELTVVFDTEDEAILTITTIESDVMNATIDPTSISFYEHEFPEYTDITITWNDASDVTGLYVLLNMGWGVEEFPWPYYELTDNEDGTANLRILFDEVDKAKAEEFMYVTVKIAFDIGAPAIFRMIIINEYYEVNVTVVPSFAGWVNGDWDYGPGDEVELWAFANWGYEFVQWEDMDGKIVSVENPYIFEMPKEDVNLVARFIKTYPVWFSVQGNDWGTLTATVNGEPIENNDFVPEGSTVIFTATPNAGYMVAAWYFNWDMVENFTDLQFTVEDVSEDINVNVSFMEIPEGYHLLTYSVVGANGTLVADIGEDEVASGTAVLEGSDITFTASPAHGYLIKEWTVNGDPIADFTDSELLVENISADLHVTVEFEMITYQVTFSVVEVGGETNGTLTAEVGGEAITSGDHVNYGSNVVFTAAPASGFKVKEWKVNNEVVADHTALTLTVNGLDEDIDVTVEFDSETSAPVSTFADVKAYPNPFGSLINFSNASLVKRVIVTNLIGQKLIDVALNGSEWISTGHLNSGVYLITIEGANGQRIVRRMVKQ